MNDTYFLVEQNLHMIYCMNQALKQISNSLDENERLNASLFGITESINQQLQEIESKLRGEQQ